MVSKMELIFVLPNLGKTSFNLKRRLRRTIERNLPYCKLKVIFRPKCRLTSYFVSKIRLKKSPLWKDLLLYV